MDVDFTESVSSALSGANALIERIHGQGADRWMRRMDNKNIEEPLNPDDLGTVRRFNVHFNVKRDPAKKVTITMDVRQLRTTEGDEEWTPIYGIVHFYQNGEKCSAIHCIFNPSGNLSLYPGFKNYPYMLMLL